MVICYDNSKHWLMVAIIKSKVNLEFINYGIYNNIAIIKDLDVI